MLSATQMDVQTHTQHFYTAQVYSVAILSYFLLFHTVYLMLLIVYVEVKYSIFYLCYNESVLNHFQPLHYPHREMAIKCSYLHPAGSSSSMWCASQDNLSIKPDQLFNCHRHKDKADVVVPTNKQMTKLKTLNVTKIKKEMGNESQITVWEELMSDVHMIKSKSELVSRIYVFLWSSLSMRSSALQQFSCLQITAPVS